MSHNTFGHLFRVTTWGESHGPAIGCVIDGCPPLSPRTAADLQPWRDRRKPGGCRFVTQRRESDTARILSGIFDDGAGPVTTGTPIAIQIDNEDARSKDYGDIARAFRPGHADFTYQAKSGVRDHRGGGRSSARETALRVAAGAVARKVLGETVRIRAGVVQLGPYRIAPEAVDFDAVYDNALFAASAGVVPAWEAYLDGVRKAGSSIGAVVALEVTGVPGGWGAPGEGKIDAAQAA
ncbi:MAG: chorismate synthase, partial [Brevundimonas sp.]|nr:chorismate synthase [Brevundimonas sp.]